MRTAILFILSVALGTAGTTVTDTIKDSSGRTVNGSITFTPTTSFESESSANWVSQAPVSARIVNGAFSITLEPTPAGDCYNVSFLPASIGARQIAAVPSTSDTLTLANVVNAFGCGSKAAVQSKVRYRPARLIVMTPSAVHQVLYYDFIASDFTTVYSMAAEPLSISRTGHWAMAIYDETCRLLGSTSTYAVNPFIETTASLPSPISLAAGSTYFVAVTTDVFPVSLMTVSLNASDLNWSFTGSNPSTGTTTLVFPSVCGQPGVGYPPLIPGDIYIQ